MKKIRLSNGHSALVDDKDYKSLSAYSWYEMHGYAVRIENYRDDKKMRGRIIRMHRLITKAPKDKYVDHINGNRLDNQRSNLRLVSPSENQYNRKIGKNNTSGYKGVHWSKSMSAWEANIRCQNKWTYLGKFENIQEAALAYNEAAKRMFGKFAVLNQIKF
jgi:hypothetical protein